MGIVSIKRENDTVRVLFSNATKVCFSATGENLGKIPILKDSSGKVMSILKENEEKIIEIAEKYQPELILACSNELVKKVIRFTKEYEIDVYLCITKAREILHYIPYTYMPDDQEQVVTFLLISCDD